MVKISQPIPNRDGFCSKISYHYANLLGVSSSQFVLHPKILKWHFELIRWFSIGNLLLIAPKDCSQSSVLYEYQSKERFGAVEGSLLLYTKYQQQLTADAFGNNLNVLSIKAYFKVQVDRIGVRFSIWSTNRFVNNTTQSTWNIYELLMAKVNNYNKATNCSLDLIY